jgi:hypothetical protein
MTLKADEKSNKKSTLINKKTILLFLQLSLTVLILLGGGLAPIGSSAQSIPSNSSAPSLSNPNLLSSPFGPNPAAFPPLPISPELSAVQKGASTNKMCTPASSSSSPSSHLKGTPQQTEGPYFVDGMPNRSDIRSDPSDGSVQNDLTPFEKFKVQLLQELKKMIRITKVY